MNQIFCPNCKLSISPEMNFCPQCGKQLRIIPISTSASEQIKVYLICILVPPFGLWYTYKYFKRGDRTGKIIGYITIILTATAIVFLVWLVQSLINTANQTLQGYNF